MLKHGPRPGWMLGALLLAAPLMAPQAAPPASPAPAEPQWELLAPLEVVELDNGMTFLIYPNRRAPIFTGVIRYDVGGKDEVPGQTGISHMFEHMAFKGTERIGTTDLAAELEALERVERAVHAYDAARNRLERAGADAETLARELAPLREAFEQAQAEAAQYVVNDEFNQIYSREGGTGLNAYTSSDATVYFVSLPANRIDLWARMESERLTMPVMREFYSERDVVLEERRMRRDNSPTGMLWDLTMSVAYIAHPYRYPVIGWADDIRNLKATEAYEFFRTHYTPERAVGVLVGDLDVARTRALLEETFGRIPAAPDDREALRIVPEPPQQGERRVALELDATPTLLMGWHKPSAPHIDDARAEVLMEVLTGGRSARWTQRLVIRERLAADISTFSGPGQAEPNLFMVWATPQGETTVAQLEAAIREEVARLRAEPVGEAELERARRMLEADTRRALETNRGLALRLAESADISGDPYYLERRLRQLQQVTAEDLLAFARAHLTEDNLTVGFITAPADAETQ